MTTTNSTSHIGRTILKVLLWIIGIPLLLVILVIIALQFTAVQNFLADKGTAYLSDKLKTTVSIGRVKTDFRNSFVLEDFYMEDQKKDTLLYAGRLGIDINFFSLLNSNINISSVTLRNATAHIKTFMPDSTTNYDFVLNAFAADTATAQPVDTTTASKPFTYTLGDIQLENIFLTMDDQVYGNNVRTRIGNLEANINEINPDKEIYRIKGVTLQNSYANIIQTKVPDATDTTETKPLTMQFGLGRVNLENIKLNYQNTVAAQRILLNVGKTELTTDNIDLINAKVDLNKFAIENTSVAYFQDKATHPDSLAIDPAETAKEIDEAVEKQEGEPVNWVVSLKDMNIAGLNVQFGNYNTPEQKRGMDFNHLNFSDINLDVDNLYYSADRIGAELNTLRLKEKSGFEVKNFTADINVDSTSAEMANLNLETGESIIRRYLSIGYPSLETIADNINLLTINADMANTKIGFRDLLYFQPTLADNPSFRSLLNRPLYVDGRITGRVDNLQIQRFQAAGLNGTALQVTGTVTGLPDVDKTNMNININRFTIARSDIMAFLPPGSLPAGYQIPSRISASGGIRGGMQNLALQNVRVNAAPGTALQISGNLRNLTNPDNLYANLNIQNFSTTSTDIKTLLPASLIPTNIRLPQSMRLTGSFVGSLENFTTTPIITTSFGNARANFRMQPGERFNGTVGLDKFNLGRMMMMDTTLGTITVDARVNGTGLTPETMQANLDATIQQVQYNKYNYKDIAIKGGADRNVYSGVVSMKDQNLSFDFDGKADMSKTEPRYSFALDLEEANLQALNFYDQALRLHGDVVADIQGTSLNTLNGTVDANNFMVKQNTQTYTLDSMFVRMANSVGNTDITLRSDILNGFFRGQNSAEDLAVAFTKYADSYFNFQDEAFPTNVNLNDFNFDFRIRRTDLLTSGLVPDLKKFGPGTFSGAYTSNNRNLNIEGYLPQIVYATYTLDSMQLNFRGDATQIDYGLTLKELSDSTMLIKNMALAGFVKDNNLKVRAGVSEDNGQERFALGGLLNTLQNAYQFKFTPGDVVINKEAWDVTPDNFIQYYTNSGAVFANNVRLERSGSSLAINSQGTNRTNAPLQISFGNFDLGYISRAIERTDSLVSGTINGNVVLRDIATKLSFTSDLKVSNLTYLKSLIGDIGLQASNAAGDRYNVLATLTGNGNNISIDGYYIAQTTSNALNLNANISSVNLGMIEQFSAGQLADLSGSLSGQLAITGSVTAPTIRGNTNFNNAYFRVVMINSRFHLANENISFNEQGINFNNFTLADSANNKMVMNGTVFTQNYLDYRFGLNIDANNFIVMNSTSDDNELFWGKLIMDADADIQGDMNLPVVKTNLKVLDGSALSMAIPSEAAGRVEHEGIVEFVDMSDTLAARLAQLQSQRDTLSESGFTGLDVTAVLDIAESVPFNIVIDPVSGDFMQIQGKTLLNAGMDPSGRVNLSGRFEATAGKYQLNFYGLVKREFNIDPGSTVTWTGDPMSANVDVRAIYNVETSPMDLIAAQDPGAASNNALRQALPFQVFINLRGELLRPEISFDIKLPENERGAPGAQQAATRLNLLRQDVSEMNRQVFSLIVLGRFMGQDPLQSSGGSGGGIAGMARNSVSDLLSDQLGKVTGRYLGGLGLELGLNTYEDYSTGEAKSQTDLNVAFNRQFLNNRLVVQVGTDIGIDGKNPAQQSSNGGFAGNLSVEYMITRDGRLRIRGFKQNAAEVLTEAEVQETGLALIFVRDYDNFSDLFRSMAKTEERNRRKDMQQ